MLVGGNPAKANRVTKPVQTYLWDTPSLGYRLFPWVDYCVDFWVFFCEGGGKIEVLDNVEGHTVWLLHTSYIYICIL